MSSRDAMGGQLDVQFSEGESLLWTIGLSLGICGCVQYPLFNYYFPQFTYPKMTIIETYLSSILSLSITTFTNYTRINVGLRY